MIEALAILGVTVLLAAQFVLPLSKAMGKTMAVKQLSPLSPPSIKTPAPPPPPSLSRSRFSRPLADGGGMAIDIAKLDGEIAQSSVKKVHAIVDRHPGAALHLIRHWMHKSA